MVANLNLNYGVVELTLKMSSMKFIFPKDMSQNIVVLPYAFSFIFLLSVFKKTSKHIIYTISSQIIGDGKLCFCLEFCFSFAFYFGSILLAQYNNNE